MKRLLILISCVFSSFLNSDSTTFSKDRLVTFYESFLCAEKDDLAAANLTSSCSLTSGNPTFVPPPDPPPPPFITGLLPIVLVNNSGFPDNEVFVVVTGVSVDGQNQVWGVIDTAGIATLQDVALTDNSTTFSYPLSSLPQTRGGHVIYLPQIRSSLIWFSMLSKLSMTVNNVSPEVPPLQIVQPNFTNPLDANYYTNFDIFELTYLLAGAPQVSADATAVSFFSIPLYGYLAGATSVSSHTGLYQPRSYIMSYAASVLDTAPLPERAQWNALPLRNGNQVLRLSSTGKAIAASLFDANYLDDAAAYGYSYLNDIWTGGASSFYVQHNMNITVGVTVPSTATYDYTGQVQPDNTFVFTSSNGGPPVTFPAPVTAPTPTGTTTFNIFSAINFISPLPTAGTAADALSKLVQEAIIAGLVPTTNNLSLSYLTGNQPNYYKVNTSLLPAGQTSGPWYDLYSKALHALGSIYTYGFDDALWPQVLLGAPFTDGVTYLGITIGNVQ